METRLNIDVIRYMVGLKKKGRTNKQVAAKLNREGFRTANGLKWKAHNVQTTIHRYGNNEGLNQPDLPLTFPKRTIEKKEVEVKTVPEEKSEDGLTLDLIKKVVSAKGLDAEAKVQVIRQFAGL